MKTHALAVAAVAALAGVASAQSITTLFNQNNGGNAGGSVYFDIVTGANPLLITGFDTNTSAVAGAAVPFRAWIGTGTSAGNETNLAYWGAPATSGSGVSAGTNGVTAITLNNNILLAANSTYGISISLSDGLGSSVANAYSGTGTSPAPGALQYSNADVTLNLGRASNVPFTAPLFNPRIWNGTIHYDVVPAPASLAMLGLGGLVAGRRRR